MADWPAEYVRQHWTPIEPILWPGKWDCYAKSLIMKGEKSRFKSKTTRGADRGLAHLTMHGDCIDECPGATSHPTGPKSNLGRRCLSATRSRFRLYPRRFVNW